MPQKPQCPICHAILQPLLTQDERSVLQCPLCGLFSIQPQPSPQDLQEFYLHYDPPSHAPTFQQHLTWRKNRHHPVFQDGLRTIQQRKPRGHLLEIGCSFGFFLQMAQQAGYHTKGIDLSPMAVQYAQQTLGLDVSCQPFEEAQYNPEQFDIVVMFAVFEHLPNPLQTIQHIHLILKPNGLLYLRVPNAHFNLLRAKLSPKLFYFGSHLFNFTTDSLTRLLSSQGFSHIELSSGRPDRHRHPLIARLKTAHVTLAQQWFQQGGQLYGPTITAIAQKSPDPP